MSDYWVSLSENNKIKVESGVTWGEALKRLDPRLARQALAVKIKDKALDLSAMVVADAGLVQPLDFNSIEGKEIFRHSTAHLMAAAVKDLYPESQVTIGPAISDGFYYDFEREEPFTPQDLTAIEKRMQELVKQNLPFIRQEMSKAEARALFARQGEKYKLELLDAIPDDIVSTYTLGKFVDLCRGPHVSYTSKLQAFKLLSVAGAYWRGDEHNKMLQRIYGTSFEKPSELEEHLKRLEEAKRRDHRVLGKQLDLFSLHEEAGAGLVYWHPKGALIRKVIEDFWREEHLKNGYEILFTPHIGKAKLWETSGHLSYYKDFMYSPMQIDKFDYYIKPMNCPFHLKIYKTSTRSYRQMPMRWAELGTVYRYEKSGVLHGLFRVRGFTQDDAHIFCTREQLEQEIVTCLKFVLFVLKTFGFQEYEVFLSTRPNQDTVGTDEGWSEATAALKKALEIIGLNFTVDEGGGAFYGPKVDIKIKDSLERTWQCSTVQVDFNNPERFDINYVGEDGKEHRPIMIHRALMGSLERFFGVMVEHYGGAFPVWLAPVQARICTIADRHADYAQQVRKMLKDAELRVEIDVRSEKINAKIRDAQLEKIPYMLIIGDREVENKTAALRLRTGENQGPIAIAEIIELIKTKQQQKDMAL